MRLTLIAVGRARAGLWRDLHEFYIGRVRWPADLREIEARRGLRGREQRRDEGIKILASIPTSARVVALDEAGVTLSSKAFAEWIGQALNDGVPDLTFIIGGPEGLDHRILARSDLTLSLGRMTWPHMLVRGLLAEQLYRAQQILAGHPYHRE